MPVLVFFAVASLALLALLFVADATLEKGSSPIVTSNRVGLPEQPHPDPIQVLTSAPAPAPDMNSQAVLAAQPKSTRHKVKRESVTRRPFDFPFSFWGR